MARFSFLQRGNLADHARELSLTTYTPSISLDNLLTGVDNVRHDVFLSPRFTEVARLQLFKLLAKYGAVEELVAEDPYASRTPGGGMQPGTSGKIKALKTADPADFKRMLADLQVMALNRGKAEGSLSLDLLARLSVLKFLRAELSAPFAQVMERCRAKLKSYEGPRQAAQQKGVELREKFAQFQVSKRAVLRRAGQELFETLREVEKETLSKMRRALFGDAGAAAYDLFLNRLLFTEDGRDDYLNAEHYVMLGNFERDPDRFQFMLDIALGFLKSLNLAGEGGEEASLDAYLSAPENAQELVAGGAPDESTPRGKAQKALLVAWL